ncbi:MAG: hypothetical protein ABIW76_15300 [Fibrobacteria bacterium]
MEWAASVGRFFQAMGLLETITMEFVAQMAAGFKFKSLKKKYLSQKLTFVIEGLAEHSDADAPTVAGIQDALEALRQLSFFRNVLAHGAMGLSGWDAEGPVPRFTGLLNYRPDETDQEAEIVSLDEVKGRLGEAEALAVKLAGQFNGLTFAPLEKP